METTHMETHTVEHTHDDKETLHNLNVRVTTAVWHTLKRVAKLKGQLDHTHETPSSIVRLAVVEYLTKRELLEQ